MKTAQPNNGTLPGFKQTDMLVLKAICEKSLNDDTPSVRTATVLKILEAEGISQAQTYESLGILDEKYFIKAKQSTVSSGIDSFEITTDGFENYANIYIPEFDNFVNRTLKAINNEILKKESLGTKSIVTNESLSKCLDIFKLLVNCILDILSAKKYIVVRKRSLDGLIVVDDITTSGKRAARSI